MKYYLGMTNYHPSGLDQVHRPRLHATHFKKMGHLNVSETAVTIYFKFCTLPVSVSTHVPPFGRADLENSEASRKSVLKLLPPQTHTKQYRER